MIFPFSRYKLDLFKRGYIYLWCKKCGKTTLHRPVTVRRGFVTKKTKFKCTECGNLTEKRSM